jgi:hypothetical protein
MYKARSMTVIKCRPAQASTPISTKDVQYTAASHA